MLYLDNVNVLLIGLIIAAHGVLGYSSLDIWPYAEMKEATLADATHTLLYALVAPLSLVLIPTMFLMAGLLTPGSLPARGLVRSPATAACGSASRSRCTCCWCSRC